MKYLEAVRARGSLVVAAGVLLLALVFAPGAAARQSPHHRHVEVQPATTQGSVVLEKRGGLSVGVTFAEPHEAVLEVGRVDEKTKAITMTSYGARFQGSLLGGRVRARFGSIGSISLRFRPEGKPGYGRHLFKQCRGARPREEKGSFVGHVSLRGEGGYFHVSTSSAKGELHRTFTQRCHVRQAGSPRRFPSLREAVQPLTGLVFLLSALSTNPVMLLADSKEEGRGVLFYAVHQEGAPAGAEFVAMENENQGKMPVGRIVWVPASPAGSLVTTLPGEHPATATLKSVAPFSGKAEYVGTSPTSHEWTGDLAVQFPGLLQPLTGPNFESSLCVVSTLRKPDGCTFSSPNLQGSEVEGSALRLLGLGPELLR